MLPAKSAAFRGWGISAIIVSVLVLAAFGSAVQANSGPVANSRLAQEGSTPTPGFGPVITPGGAPLPTATPETAPPTTTPETAPLPTATPEITGTPLPGLHTAVMGIQVDPAMSMEDYDTALWLVQRLGVKWIKFQFAWDLMEPEPGVFSEVFYKYRLFVQKADNAGLNVMISIAKAPDWARASLEEDGPPRDPQYLANFITHLMNEVRVDLYGNSYFEAIEIWNEPNLRREWNGGALNGAEYMQLFDVAYNAIRAGEGGHSVTVISAGLAPTGWNDGITATDDRAYFRQMYDAGLGNPAYQNIAIGVHPYSAANPPDARWCGEDTCSDYGYDNHPSWFFLNTLEDYHAIMNEYGDGGRQLWATEFGWGTYENFLTTDGTVPPIPASQPYFERITEDMQANYIIRAFEIGQDLPYIGTMVLWNLNYIQQPYVDASDERSAYAILRPEKSGPDPLRPAFQRLEAAPKVD